MNQPIKILFVFSVYNMKPEKFFQRLDSVLSCIEDKINYHLVICINKDDKKMQTTEVKNHLNSYLFENNISVAIVKDAKETEWQNHAKKINYEYDFVLPVQETVKYKSGFDTDARKKYFKQNAPKINLWVNFYEDKNDTRNKELQECLFRNLTNNSIDTIYLFLTKESEKRIIEFYYCLSASRNKMVFITKETRPTFRDYFEEINKRTGDNDINIISNSDIYFDETIQLAHTLTHENCYALCRWDIQPNGGAIHFNHRDSQDTWIFKGKIKYIHDCDFTLGRAGCDNAIAERLNRSGYKVEPVSLSIKTYHLHLSKINNYNPQDAVKEPYLLMEPTAIAPEIEKYTIQINNEPENDLPEIHFGFSKYPEIDNAKVKRKYKDLKVLNISLMADDAGNGFVNAMKQIAGGGYQHINPGTVNFNNKAVEMAKNFQPHIIFIQVQAENIITTDTADKLSKIGFCINWTGDVRHELPQWMIEIGKHVQLTAFSNMVDVKNMRALKLPADYLEIGVDETRYTKHNVPHYCHEIVAFFNDYGTSHFPLSGYRREIVDCLHTNFSGQFGVYGNYPNAAGDFNNNQVRESEQYNNCKIAINCSHFNYERYSSDRILRAMASGAFVLSHHYDGIEHDFKVGKHLDTFKDLNELVEKCNYYLQHEAERNKIANAGYEHVRANFTFTNMCENIVELYNKWK